MRVCLTIPIVPLVGPLVSASISAHNDSLDFRSILERCSATHTLDPISLVLLLTKMPKLFPPSFLIRPPYPSICLVYTGLVDYTSAMTTYPNWPWGTSTSLDGSSSMVGSAPTAKPHKLPKEWSLSQPETVPLWWA
jgi:hypothetical protein